MKRLQYPDYQAHHEEHVFFVEQIQHLLQRTKHGSFHAALVREVNFYIVEWFTEHVRLIDMNLIRFLNEKSAEDKTCLHFLDYIPTSLSE